MEWSDNVAEADWLVHRLHPFAADVGALVPEGFAAYVRILHPAWRTAAGEQVRVRWAELAGEAGTSVHPTIQFESLDRDLSVSGIEPPRTGTLDPAGLGVLTETLADHTGQPESCWFALWDGYGWLQGPPATAELVHRRQKRRWLMAGRPAVRAAAARINIPGRSMVLYTGPIKAAAEYCRAPTWQSPNLWWPNDRAWCVASEIDLHSTYLGGPRELADQLLCDGRIEALPAKLGDPINAGASS